MIWSDYPVQKFIIVLINFSSLFKFTFNRLGIEPILEGMQILQEVLVWLKILSSDSMVRGVVIHCFRPGIYITSM